MKEYKTYLEKCRLKDLPENQPKILLLTAALSSVDLAIFAAMPQAVCEATIACGSNIKAFGMNEQL